MTQVEKIKAEVERRINENERVGFFNNANELASLLPFIESLEQKAQCNGCINDKGCVTCVDGNMKETQPKGLDEAAEEWVGNNCFDCDCVGENRAWDAFMAGAKWMAEQGETNVLTVESPVLGPPMICCPVNARNGDKVIVQIRKI